MWNTQASKSQEMFMYPMCRFSDEGTAALASILGQSVLRTLDLSNSCIGPEGASALAIALGASSASESERPKLTSLNLGTFACAH